MEPPVNERTIFVEALERASPAGRAAYLDAACAGDPALRERVEALLRSHDEAGEFLNRPAPERLAGGPVVGLPADEIRTGPAASDGDVPLDFLTPSNKPGSLGRLGHYEVQTVVGRGGMGVVLKAFDENLHRVVAVKVLAPQLAASATARQRFTREARAAAAVTHDHVVTTHAVDEAGGLPYLVMQYVDGVSLQERVDRTGSLPLQEILRIGVQAAAGLAAAHKQGLVHRDVKPANILLENGVERVKLTDFGLARAADDASLTHSGAIAGTPQYMSPEQAEGKPVDARSDLFSLGSVLYAMCAGRPPFRAGTSMGVLKRLCEETATPIREINPEIPAWLAAVIEKLHAKDPAGRFQTAEEVDDLLGRHLAHVQHPSVVPMPATETPAAPPRLSRGRARRVVAAVVLAVLVAGLGMTEATGVTKLRDAVIRVFTPEGTLVVETDDPDVRVTVEGDGGLAITGAGPQAVRLKPGSYRVLATKDGHPVRTEFVTISRGDKQVVRVSLEPGGRAGVAAAFHFTPPPPGPLDRLDPAAIPAEDRFPWQPKELVAVLGEHRGRHWHPAVSVAYSPDGTLVASGCGGGEIRLWDAETLRERAALTGHSRSVAGVAFSPDSRFLLSGGHDRTVRLWDVATGRELRRFDGHTAEVTTGVTFSPDGRRALSGGWDGDNSVRLWEVETGRELLRCTGHTAGVRGVAISADGRRALSGGNDRTVRLWDLETAEELRCFRGHTDRVAGVALSPDGRLALSGGGTNDPTVRLWEVETGRELRAFAGHTRVVHCVAFSPDGRRALSCGDRTIRLWDVDSGKELRHFEVGVDGWSVAFSPDGRRAISAGDGLRVWNPETGTELCPRRGHPISVRGVAFSPDGRRVLSCSECETAARLWDIETRQEVRRLEGHTAGLHGVAFSPDGRRALSGGQDRTVRLWDVDTGQERLRFEGHTHFINSVAFSPDGRWALSGGGETRFWDTTTGRELRRFDGPEVGVWGVAFSPDGTRVLSGGGNDAAARLWDVESGQAVRRFEGHTAGLHGVAFAPDGRSAFSAGVDGTVRLWDLAATEPQHRTFPRWHTHRVWSLAAAPDGKKLASCGYDGQIILWEAATGTKLRDWKLPGLVRVVAFAPDARHLAVGNANGTVYVLRVTDP